MRTITGLLIGLFVLSATLFADKEEKFKKIIKSLISLDSVVEQTGIKKKDLINKETSEEIDFILEGKLPESVDNSKNLTSIKDQGSRATCTAFATIASLEGKFEGQYDLSEQHLYYQVKKHFLPKMDGILPEVIQGFISMKGPLCVVEESGWAYNKDFIKENIPQGPPPSNLPDLLQICINETSYLNPIIVRNTTMLKAILADGYTILVSVILPKDWTTRWFTKENIINALPLKPESFIPVNAHSILLVGYDHNDNFIFRNSWAETWGKAGYGFFKRNYIHMYAISGLIITDYSEEY